MISWLSKQLLINFPSASALKQNTSWNRVIKQLLLWNINGGLEMKREPKDWYTFIQKVDDNNHAIQFLSLSKYLRVLYSPNGYRGLA